MVRCHRHACTVTALAVCHTAVHRQCVLLSVVSLANIVGYESLMCEQASPEGTLPLLSAELSVKLSRLTSSHSVVTVRVPSSVARSQIWYRVSELLVDRPRDVLTAEAVTPCDRGSDYS